VIDLDGVEELVHPGEQPLGVGAREGRAIVAAEFVVAVIAAQVAVGRELDGDAVQPPARARPRR
jgi:hypothetical protein